MSLPKLYPASFRGVAFQVRGHGSSGGRRLASFEFPLRDDGAVQDMGQRQRVYRLSAFLLGANAPAAAANLQYACEAFGFPGTLVHPWLGRLMVSCDRWSRHDDVGTGNMIVFDLDFIEAGALPSPVATIDTSSQVAMAADDNLSALQIAFNAIHSLAHLPHYAALHDQGIVDQLGGYLGNLVGVSGFAPTDLIAAVLTLKQTPIVQLALSDSIAATLMAPFSAYATYLTSILTTGGIHSQASGLSGWVPSSLDTVGSGSSSASSFVINSRGDLGMQTDPSFGLAVLAAWSPNLTTSGADTAVQVAMGTNAQAITNLVNGAAVTAMAQVYATTDWPNAQAALAARTQMMTLINAQIQAADALGQGQSVMAWQPLQTAVYNDLTTRAAQVPSLTTYQVAANLPALVLAHKLYQDASRADEIVAMTGAVHPGFMPKSGMVLSN